MKLSVIIVNYNVKYFLEQAILCTRNAIKNITAEIFVVDNNSSDGSVECVRSKFPEVKMIENVKNLGFSAANNQAIHLASGQYILLLNPDTVLAEDTLEKCVSFMDQHPEAGALGVKMLDGKGNFLPESKRAFPSPKVAFYKAFGLSALFPKSRIFGQYHLGYLNEQQTHQVDVLAGAFMCIRKEALNTTGLLDESFFMYGEDIDLSYRIVQAGYKNYYFASTEIIHYKGESTKKASLNYVKMFYNAMKIFAKKHFTGTYAGTFVLLLNLAIYFRALLALVSRGTKRIALPLLDTAFIFTGMLLIKEYWEYYVRYIDGGQYPAAYLYINVPAYITLWILCIYFSGGYDKTANAMKILRGVFWGTLVISALYGFLPEQYRFSRGMILAGAAWSSFVLISYRFLLHFLQNRNFRFGTDAEKYIIIFGGVVEAMRVKQLFDAIHLGKRVTGIITPQKTTHDHVLGCADDLPRLLDIYQCNELVFCAADIPYKQIITYIRTLGNRLQYKIINPGSDSIIGSNSKDSTGELYNMDVEFRIAKPEGKRSKRLLDVLFAFFLFITMPVQCFIVKKRIGLLKNIFLVFANKKTWVGYASTAIRQQNLPTIKPSVLSVLQKFSDAPPDENTIQRVNMRYAEHYSVNEDLRIIYSAYDALGA